MYYDSTQCGHTIVISGYTLRRPSASLSSLPRTSHAGTLRGEDEREVDTGSGVKSRRATRGLPQTACGASAQTAPPECGRAGLAAVYHRRHPPRRPSRRHPPRRRSTPHRSPLAARPPPAPIARRVRHRAAPTETPRSGGGSSRRCLSRRTAPASLMTMGAAAEEEEDAAPRNCTLPT